MLFHWKSFAVANQYATTAKLFLLKQFAICYIRDAQGHVVPEVNEYISGKS